jgi:hypothetical protein
MDLASLWNRQRGIKGDSMSMLVDEVIKSVQEDIGVNNDAYQAALAYKVARDNWTRIRDKEEEERHRLYDLWFNVLRAFRGQADLATQAINDIEKEQGWKTKAKQSSDDTCGCESTG